MPDITNNPDVVRLLRELAKAGAKAAFYRVNPRYGYVVVLLRPSLQKIVENVNAKWGARVAKVDYFPETGVAAFTLMYPDPHELTPEDRKLIVDSLRRHGVLADVMQDSPTKVRILVHVETYAKHIERKFVRNLANANAEVQFIRETAAMAIHIWTGTRPRELASVSGGEI